MLVVFKFKISAQNFVDKIANMEVTNNRRSETRNKFYLY